MTFEECVQHVGCAVVYKPRPDAAGMQGHISGVASLALVDFGGGTVLQVNPHCLDLIDDTPTLFGNTHEGM